MTKHRASKHSTSTARAGGSSGAAAPSTAAQPTAPAGAGLGAPLTPVVPSGGPSSTESTPSTPVPARVQVIAREYSFTLSRAVVPAGPVIVEFVNSGQDPHNLHLDPLAGSEAGAFGNTLPGVHSDQAFNMSAGSYTLFCSLPTHEALGMKAMLAVQ